MCLWGRDVIVFGIDQSYTHTGVCLLHRGGLKDVVVIDSDKERDMYTRSTTIAESAINWMNNKLVEFDTRDVLVVMEGLSFGTFKANATRDLAGLQYVMHHEIRRNIPLNISPIIILPPTQVKKFATGSGKASKKEMFDCMDVDDRKIIEQKYNTINKGKYDLADAYWIGRLGETQHLMKQPYVR